MLLVLEIQESLAQTKILLQILGNLLKLLFLLILLQDLVEMILMVDFISVLLGVQGLIVRVVQLIVGSIFIMHIVLDLLLVNKVHI